MKITVVVSINYKSMEYIKQKHMKSETFGVFNAKITFTRITEILLNSKQSLDCNLHKVTFKNITSNTAFKILLINLLRTWEVEAIFRLKMSLFLIISIM